MTDHAKAAQETAPGEAGAPFADKEYRAVEALAAKALMLADTWRTPPVPKTFEVWYSYAAGMPEEVAERIDRIIERDGTLAGYDLDQIHLEYLAMAETERKHHDALSAHLDHEMDEIAKLVQSHIASSDDYSGSLKETAASLTEQTAPAQIRNAIEKLLAENAKMSARTTKLGEALSQTRAQVRKLRASLEKSREKEMRDPMTKLANRRLFDLRLPHEIADAHQSGVPLCLAMADIDHFKQINDTFGHPVGDDVLRFFASILASNLKGRDLAARYGGEEFALILPATKAEAARQLIRQIMEQINATNLVMSQGKLPIGKLTASFGVVELRAQDDAGALVSRADRKLYEAKRAGRNRIACDC